MSHFFVGVDAGGSATRAVLTDAKGHVLYHATGGAANPHVHGISVSVCTVAFALTELLGDKSYGGHSNQSVHEKLVCVVVALSGADEAGMIAEYHSCLREAYRLPAHVALHIMHDSAAPAGLLLERTRIQRPSEALPAESPVPRVCVLIAGTGSVSSIFELHAKGVPEELEANTNLPVLAQDVHKLLARARAGGRGPLVGDGGSAYAIATGAVRRAMRICDGIDDDSGDPSVRSAAHEVLALAADVFNVSSDVSMVTEAGVASLAAAVHSTQVTRGEMASLARPLADAAARGNSIAAGAFAIAADDLARLVIAVASRIQVSTVIGTGGVFKAWDRVPEFRETFLRVLSKNAPSLTKLWLIESSSAHAAAIGAARLGALVHDIDDPQWYEVVRKDLRPISEIDLRDDM